MPHSARQDDIDQLFDMKSYEQDHPATDDSPTTTLDQSPLGTNLTLTTPGSAPPPSLFSPGPLGTSSEALYDDSDAKYIAFLALNSPQAPRTARHVQPPIIQPTPAMVVQHAQMQSSKQQTPTQTTRGPVPDLSNVSCLALQRPRGSEELLSNAARQPRVLHVYDNPIAAPHQRAPQAPTLSSSLPTPRTSRHESASHRPTANHATRPPEYAVYIALSRYPHDRLQAALSGGYHRALQPVNNVASLPPMRPSRHDHRRAVQYQASSSRQLVPPEIRYEAGHITSKTSW